MCNRDLGNEFDKLESAENVDSAQAATATSYKDWLDIKSVDVSVRKGLSYLLSSGRGRKEKREDEEAQKSQKSQKSFGVYYEQGELRMSDHQVKLMQFSRFGISSHSTSATEKPRTIPQLNPGQNSGQSSAVPPGLD